MTILFSSASYRLTDKEDGVGGEERISWETIRRLSERGIRCIVVSPKAELKKKYDNLEVISIKGCDYREEKKVILRRWKAWRFGIKSRKKIKRLLNTEKIDIIHHILPSYPGFFSTVSDLPKPFIWGPATIKYTRSIENKLKGNLFSEIYRKIKYRKWYKSLKNAERILVEVNDAIKEIPEEFRSKIETIHSGVDIGKFNAAYNPVDDEYKVLYLTAVRRNKGADALLKAIPGVVNKYKNVKFIFVGKNFEKEYFSKLVKDLDIEKYVEFAGPVSHTDIKKYFSQSHIYCLPSLQDNVPLSLLESMACSRPVVASALNGIKEVIDEGVNGFLCRPGNSDDLQNAILKLLDDRKLREKMAAANRKKIEDNFTWDKYTDKLCSVYKEILKKNPENAL